MLKYGEKFKKGLINSDQKTGERSNHCKQLNGVKLDYVKYKGVLLPPPHHPLSLVVNLISNISRRELFIYFGLQVNIVASIFSCVDDPQIKHPWTYNEKQDI